MAKILVADDNSNIQKMVSVTLKDQGIDVVAVGNGEAAVRKISDLQPDLVLADVFMPVRNGYEVCEFVKTNSKLAHIPVILLVGAFDPLDEQEAQRVGADGVLKKPFVPADPLISMVRSALTRAGVANIPEPPKVARAPSPRPAPGVALSPELKKDLPELRELGTIPLPRGADDAFAPPAAPQLPPVKIPEGPRPVAFSNLLGTAGTAEKTVEEETDPETLVARHPELDAGRSWNVPHAAEDTEEAEEEAAETSWRPDTPNDASAGSQVPGEDKTDWRAAVFASIMQKKRDAGMLPPEPQPKKEAAESATPKIKAEPKPPIAPGVPHPDAWSSAQSSGLPSAPHYAGDPAELEQAPGMEEPQRTARETAKRPLGIAPSTPVKEKPSGAKAGEARPKTPSTEPSWFTTQASPWDAEVQKVSELAATWNVSEAAASNIHAAVESVKAEDLLTGPAVMQPPVGAELAEVEEFPAAGAVEAEAIESEEQPAAPVPVVMQTTRPKAAESKQDMEALVAKVLEKISPEVLQQMTRELLKPVVEALVRGELDSKK